LKNNVKARIEKRIKRKRQYKILTFISLVLISIFFITTFNNKEEKIENSVKELPLKVDSTPLSLTIVKENGVNVLQATYTNDSEEVISKLVLEVKLKDTNEIIEMKCNDPVEVGQKSTVFKGQAPKSGKIEDVEVVKYKLSLRNGTYMEYDVELKQYNWS
jgi:regulatory protein YycI of two-component signal transduction system YycFG